MTTEEQKARGKRLERLFNTLFAKGEACPKCGCQIKDPFTGKYYVHDVKNCGGIVKE